MNNILISNIFQKSCDSDVEKRFIEHFNLRIEISPKVQITTQNRLTVALIGYILPRFSNYHKYKLLNQLELITNLYEKYQNRFVSHIKGNFIILIVENKKVSVFTDHFGIENLYIYNTNGKFAISNSTESFKALNIELIPDKLALMAKTLLHRIPIGKTQYKNVSKTKPASHITIRNNTIHVEEYWTPECFLKSNEHIDDTLDFNYFADLIKSNFKSFLEYLNPQVNTITLTGGKDSRTGLAALKANNIDVRGFTYGNENSKDAIYAKKLSSFISISHNIYNPADTNGFFEEYFSKIIKTGNPDISLHRAHRLYAFKEMVSTIDECSAYYAGYMAGEFLMGIYYDNLVFTKYLTDFWDYNEFNDEREILGKYFHSNVTFSNKEIRNYLADLKTFDNNLSKEERQFWGIFEIGIPHHVQDIFLSSQCFDYVYPFFIDIDFLEKLFQSRFSFFHTDNKTSNLLARYKLFEFNLNIQHILFPEMDKVPFGKRGSYNTEEFLRGKYYWTGVKTLRYLFEGTKYPSTYDYGQTFREYVLQILHEIKDDKSTILNNLFNIDIAIEELGSITGRTNEEQMHKFSNIIQLYLQLKS